MPASIAALLRRADLGMTLLSGGGGDRLDTSIRWVTTSELIDPTPYLRGGELLLTTGMRLPASRSAVADYLVRLAGVGVVGVGIGIGQDLAHHTVPPRLTHAADEIGFPLLLVDEPTPFIAIGEAVAQMHLADETAALAQALKAQQSMTRAAVTTGPAGVIRQLAALIDGWALVADVSGTVRHEAPAGTSLRHSRWRAELGRLRGGRSTSAALSDPGEYVTVQNLGDGHRLRGFLVTGRNSRPSTAHHSMTNVAAALLSVASGSEAAASASVTQWSPASKWRAERWPGPDHPRPDAWPDHPRPDLWPDHPWPGPCPPPGAGGVAEGDVMLAALADYQRRSHVSLADSLRAWLQHHGRVQPAAAALGIHRNTLAHRLQRAGEMLGRDLDDPAVRAQLWAALHASDGDSGRVQPRAASYSQARP